MVRISLFLCVGLIVAAPVGALVVEPPAPVPKRYRLIDLGVLDDFLSRSVPNDVNEHGMVVGYSETPSGRRAFVWTEADGMVQLEGIDGGYQFSVANAINDRGQIVGQVRGSNGDSAYLWDDSTTARDLGTLRPGEFNAGTAAFDINNNGQVVGKSDASLGSRAFLWTEDSGMQSLGILGPNSASSEAHGINEHGEVVGFTNVNFVDDHAFLWTPATGMMDIEPDPSKTARNSFANAINERGEIAGDRMGEEGAFIWTAAGGMEPIGDLPGANDLSLAFDINNHGQIVGRGQTPFSDHAFIWSRADGMLDLNDLLDDSANGWTVRVAHAINDRGMIAAYGSAPIGQLGFSVQRAVLLVPISHRVPEVSTGTLLMLALLLPIGMIRLIRRGAIQRNPKRNPRHTARHTRHAIQDTQLGRHAIQPKITTQTQTHSLHPLAY